MATTRALLLHIFDDRVAFEKTSDGACLVVSRNVPDGQLDSYVDEKGRVLKELEGGQVIPIDAIFGIYHLLSGPYVALVLESEVAVAVAGIEFRKVGVWPCHFGYFKVTPRPYRILNKAQCDTIIMLVLASGAI